MAITIAKEVFELRSASGMTPTETGQRFYERALRIMAEADEAERRHVMPVPACRPVKQLPKLGYHTDR